MGKKYGGDGEAQEFGADGGHIGQDEPHQQGFSGLLAELGNPFCHKGDDEKGNHKPDVLSQDKSDAG